MGQRYNPFDGEYNINDICDGSTGSIRYDQVDGDYAFIFNDPDIYTSSADINRWFITTKTGAQGCDLRGKAVYYVSDQGKTINDLFNNNVTFNRQNSKFDI